MFSKKVPENKKGRTENLSEERMSKLLLGVRRRKWTSRESKFNGSSTNIAPKASTAGHLATESPIIISKSNGKEKNLKSVREK